DEFGPPQRNVHDWLSQDHVAHAELFEIKRVGFGEARPTGYEDQGRRYVRGDCLSLLRHSQSQLR
ncbi:hypothetical protein, partial [Roseibacillus persicicus]|uniref:hypothetical protein n=1 Tax=Roseibacillus persicicus TaxID=454148 RepID=UPI00280FB4FA